MYTLRKYLRASPFLYFNLKRFDPAASKLRASSDTDLVVEGPPRCGNTTVVRSIQFANGEKLRIAHHLHVPANIIYAARRSIPCLVLLRDPIESVASLLLKEKNRDATTSVLDYIEFVRTLKKIRSHVILATFDNIMKDGIGSAIVALNDKFQCHLIPPDGSAEEREWVETQAKRALTLHDRGNPDAASFPNKSKSEKKESIRSALLQNERSDLIREARELYREAIATADV